MTRVALIAHDDEKPALIDLATDYRDTLAEFDLLATGTTGKRLVEETELDIERKASGPMGGDMQIGAEVAEDRVDGIVFLRDPLTAQPHEPDITALLRICDVHDVPLATTRTSAEYVLEGLAGEA
ncbi:methylglyoxal synthase [Halostella sp. JP-L12]|uniref:methylglyoxal synthase n=1 Tax=Halostella TaxID=1843185 RepID=UPI000EF81EFF|nr:MULTISPECIES: methylglyoxal synthase [Halostella]NHN47404.1 methylglyoxal synthase [Halostella sp. JP-L12]